MKYLLICKSNVGRSQMACAFFRQLHGDHQASSAGTHVGEKAGQGLHEYVLKVMEESGLDLSLQKRAQLTPEMVDWSQKIIVMLDDHSDLPAYVPLEKVEFWDVPDAKDKSLEFHREVRDSIRKRVEAMRITELPSL